MEKIGRNEPCPCGSGLKYKKCCLSLQENELDSSSKTEADGVISSEVAKLKSRAGRKKKSFKLLGAFVFFSTVDGDAWLLEVTEGDALSVALNGESCNTILKESEETLEVNWTHGFEIKGQDFVTTSYLDNSVVSHKKYPAQIIGDTKQQLLSNYPAQR